MNKLFSRIKYAALYLLTALLSSAVFAAPVGKTWTNADMAACNNGTIESRCLVVSGETVLPSGWTEGAIPANTAPVISLSGAATVTYTEGDTYNELGATCTDTEDGSITVPAPAFAPALNMSAAGSYVATYTCTDAGGLTDTATRTINVNSAGGSNQIAFTDVSNVINTSPHINQAFGAVMPDVNGDGCLDLFIGSHEDSTDSNILIHDNVGGVCQGTFTHFANSNNYSQASPTTPRITSRYLFGNWYDHPLGFHSFYGADVDGSASARYVLDPTFTTVGGEPQYLSKTTGCYGVRPKCLPLDIDGDGNLENVSRLFASPYNTGYIVDIDTGANIYTPTSNSGTFTQGLMVVDVDNNGYPELVQIEQGGYYEFTPAGPSLDWVGSTIENYIADGEDRHAVVLDYDLDGDLDIVQIEVPYNTSDSTGGLPHLWRNNGDGTFSDLTSTAFASMPTLSVLTGASSYANTEVADLDLDGYPDIIFALEHYSNMFTIIKNNGDGTFTKTTDIGTDPTPTSFGLNSDRPYFDAGDYDNDGLIDIVHNGDNTVGTVAQGVLLRNTTSTNNHWMRVRVRGLGSNTDGLHTRLSFFEPGTTNLITYYHTGVFAGSYNNLLTHAGLGANTVVDVRAEFPHGGPTCNFSNVAADQDYIIYRSCNIQSYTPGSAIPLTYVASNDVDTTVTLVADSAITPTATELVTFGLPFAEGEVTDVNEIKVSIGGSEVAVYVEPTLTHHWSDNSIRAATIQLQNVDMTGGDVTVTIDDTGASVARLTEVAHSTGWTTAGADKDNRQYPRIFALHDPQYLADSGIVPPFKPAPDVQDAFEDYQVGQFNNNFGALDYQASSGANWLFDRSSAMFKAYMTTGRVEFLKEAFLSKQFYFQHVRNDGTTPAPAGGDGCWTYGNTACADGKYIAPQQAKLALALVGDDSQWDNSLIIEMAQQADLGWNQYQSSDTFDNENEGFTERGAGLAGLAEIVAYEMTGDAGILATMNSRIASLKDMQQTEKSWDIANGWTPKSGGFTHNLDVHEGASNEAGAATGDTNARGFSAWMSENIADFLWQAYWVTGNSDIPGMLTRLANAVDQYGFTSVYNSGTGEHDTLAEFAALGDPIRAQSCNTTRDDTAMVYLTSAYADAATRTSGDWYPYYSDNHNIETTLILAAGYYFETDSAIKTRLAARANKLVNGWSNASCAAVFSNVYRLFNWQHRSNSVRTYDWVKENS